MSVAFLYPGRAPAARMLHGLTGHPAVTATLAEAERILPGSSRQDTAEALKSTVTTQVALCVAGVAATVPSPTRAPPPTPWPGTPAEPSPPPSPPGP